MNVTYKCGHSAVVDFKFKSEEVYVKSWFKDYCICPSCLGKTEDQITKELDSEILKQDSNPFSEFKLNGSSKQVTWAKGLQKEFYFFMLGLGCSLADISFNLPITATESFRDASFWINSRNEFYLDIQLKHYITKKRKEIEKEAYGRGTLGHNSTMRIWSGKR